MSMKRRTRGRVGKRRIEEERRKKLVEINNKIERAWEEIMEMKIKPRPPVVEEIGGRPFMTDTLPKEERLKFDRAMRKIKKLMEEKKKLRKS